MSLTRMIAAAGLVVTSLGAAAAVQAQPARVVTTRTVTTTHVSNTHRGWHGPRCHTEWRRHHRVRVCR